MIHAGKLTQTFLIERVDTSTDAYGAPAELWRPLRLCRAELVEAKREDNQGSNGAATRCELLFRLRWTHVLLEDRVVYDGRTYQVAEIHELGRRRALELRVTSQGQVLR